MRIAVCDDEKEYTQLVYKYVNFYFNEKHIDFECFKFYSGEELLSAKQDFDIVFLDIEMNKLNGIQTAKEINRRNKKTLVFIVTAYQQYLDEAMDLDVFRYIDKPVKAERLYKGLDKAIDYINNNDISFRTRDNEIITMKKSDIVYVEVLRKKVYLTVVDGTYLTREKMEFFKEKLTASYFVIPHNSYIVNLNFVSTFKRDSILLKNKQIISIAPKRQAEIKKKFMHFIGEDYDSLSSDF